MKYRNADIQICHTLYQPEQNHWQIVLAVGYTAYIAEFPGDPEKVEFYNLKLYEMGRDYCYTFEWITDQHDVSMRLSKALIIKLIATIHMEFKLFTENEGDP